MTYHQNLGCIAQGLESMPQTDGLGAGQRQSWDLQADSVGAGPKDRAGLGSGDVGHRRLRPSGSWAEGPAAEAEPLQGPCWRTAAMTEPLQGPCWRPATKGTSAAQELGQMQLSRRRGNFCSRGSGDGTGAGGKRPNHDRLCIEKRN